jgi:hypothetical protein
MCMHVYIYIYIYISKCICICICRCRCLSAALWLLFVCLLDTIDICIHTCMCTCMCMYMCICTRVCTPLYLKMEPCKALRTQKPGTRHPGHCMQKDENNMLFKNADGGLTSKRPEATQSAHDSNQLGGSGNVKSKVVPERTLLDRTCSSRSVVQLPIANEALSSLLLRMRGNPDRCMRDALEYVCPSHTCTCVKIRMYDGQVSMYVARIRSKQRNLALAYLYRQGGPEKYRLRCIA